jgi:hypothetical protein
LSISVLFATGSVPDAYVHHSFHFVKRHLP